MQTQVNGTFRADHFSCFFAAVQAGGRAVGAFAAFLAPASDLEITFRALRAVISFVSSAFHTKDAFA